MKKSAFVITVILFTLTTVVHAQIGTTSYSIHALAINTNKGKKLSGEMKGFFNRELESTLFELAGMYNFSRKTYHQFSVGLGLNVATFSGIDEINSFTIPLQLEIFPLQNFKQLSLIFDLTPELYLEGDTVIRQLWGIRYSFNKK